MKDVRVEKCCCCNLETGCTILGALSLIGGIITLIGGGAVLGGGSSTGSGLDYLLSGICAVIAGICLLIGVRKSNANLLIPYLIVLGIGIIKYVILAIWYLIDAIGGKSNKNSHPVGGLIFSIIFFILAVYFWIVVYSLYKKLRDGGITIRNTSSAA